MSPDRTATILLRSSWQTVNIGDVAHSPGALAAFERFAPEAEVVLWPVDVGARERAMLLERFPGLRIVEGVVGQAGRASTPELQRAWDESDLLVHGSAAGIIDLETFGTWQATARPYGFFGVTVDPLFPFIGGTLDHLESVVAHLPKGFMDPELRDVLDGAAFVYCRDSISSFYLRTQLDDPTRVAHGADATFAFDAPDEAGADAILDRFGLTSGEFLCFVPRARYAPYHLLRGYEPRSVDLLKQAVTTAHLADDLGVAARVIEDWVRSTGKQVLVAPEMSNAIELTDRELLPRLASDVRDHVHHLGGFWPLETAMAVFARAAGIITMECHSGILGVRLGVPTVYLRLPSETFKGRMFADYGVPAVVELDEDAPSRVAAVLAQDPVTARRDAERALDAALAELDSMAATAVRLATTAAARGPQDLAVSEPEMADDPVFVPQIATLHHNPRGQ